MYLFKLISVRRFAKSVPLDFLGQFFVLEKKKCQYV